MAAHAVLHLPHFLGIFTSPHFRTPMSAIADYIDKLGERDSRLVKGGILFLFIFIVALMFPSGESIESEYHVGMIWTDNNLTAPFLFPIYKEENAYQREKLLAAQNVYKVFEKNSTISRKNIDTLQKFFGELQIGRAHV